MKLNLGGGSTKIEGFLNVDILKLPEVDIVCDVTKGIPLADNTVDEIYAAHFIEHIEDTTSLMKEIYRVSKNGALIRFKMPYFKSTGAFKDPTHVSFFTEKTFEYFDKDFVENKRLPDYLLDVNFKTQKISFIWSHKVLRFIPGKKFLMHYLWNIARTMYIELRVIK